MDNFRWENLQQAILNFAKNEGSQYKFLEFWIDTSIPKIADQSPSLYLVFHAFNTNDVLEDVIQKVRVTQDFGFIADCIDDVSRQVWFEFAEIDQRISSGIGFVANNAEQEMINAISFLVKKENQIFQGYSKIFLYWIGNTDFTWIKK